MFLRRFTSYLVLTSYIAQSCLPTFAMESIDRVTEQSEKLKHGAVPALLDFKANPNQTSGGCLFYARGKVLLGLRDDEETFCNPGGKSDKEDEYISQTAAREGAEETLFIYCSHSDILRTQPFVDLYLLKKGQSDQSPQPFLNRMYFVEVEYVEDSTFNERLANPERLGLSKTSLEYRKYQWVLVKDVLQAIEQGKSKVTMSDTGEEIALYEPLYQTLSTETSKNLLTHLVDNKEIPSVPKKKSPVFKNKVHMEGHPSINHTAKFSWEIHTVNGEELAREALERKKANLATLLPATDVIKNGKDTYENVVLQPIARELIDFDQDAFGNKSGIRLMGTEQQHVPYDFKRNRLIMGKAVAAKAAANLELKKLWNEPQNTEKKKKQLQQLQELDTKYFEKTKADFELKDSYHTVTLPQTYAFHEVSPVLETSSIPLKQEHDYTQHTLSDLLLQFQLGPEYVHPTNPYSQQSRLEANAENLKRYHTKYSGDNSREMKRKSEPVSTDYMQIAQVMELVKQHPGWLPIHHASQGDVKFLWTASTSLFELLFLNPYPKDTLPVMRATDLYFNGHDTMAESLQRTGTEDYQNGNMNRRLCGNMCVSSGIATTYTSSNSIEYFCNAHSVDMPSLPKKYQEGAELLGMVGVSYLPYQSIFEQFYGAVNTKLPNSAWTIVFVKPDALDTHAHPSHGGGSVFYADNPLSRDHAAFVVPSAKGLYERAEKELLSAVKVISPDVSDPTYSSSKRANSVAEIRTTLHPKLMRDSTKTKVVSVDRFPLTEGKQRKFKQKLLPCQISDTGQWLSSHTKLIPQSLDLGENKELALKKLYALVHQGLTGKPVEETLSLEAFKHLIRNGQAEGAQQLYDVFPDLLQRITHTPMELVNLAIASGDVETLQFVLEKVLKTKICQFFTRDDIIAFGMACLTTRKFSAAHEYVLLNVDSSLIDQSIRRDWATKFLPHGSAEDIERIHASLHPITLDVIADAVKVARKSSEFHSWKGLPKFKGISKAEIADTFLAQCSSGCSFNEIQFLGNFLCLLLQNGLSYSDPLPISGNPLLFSLPYILASGDSNEAKHLTSILANDAKLLDYKNSEGLGLLAYIQRRFMIEGVPIYNHFNHEILEKQIKARKESSASVECYGPFQQEFGDMDLFRMCNPLPCKNSEFSSWRADLQAARESNSLTKILATWSRVPNPEYLDFYRTTDPYLYLICKLPASGRPLEHVTHEKIIQGINLNTMVEECIHRDDYSGLFKLIDNALQNGVSFAISGALKGLNGISSIQESRKNTVISAYDLTDLLAKPDEFVKALEAGQVVQHEFVKSAYALRDEHVEIVRKALPILFKNPSELVTVTSRYDYGVLHWAMSENPTRPKLVKCLLEYGGCFNLLSLLPNAYFATFLHTSSDDMLGWVSSESPQIFSFCDATRNFLELSIRKDFFLNLKFFKDNFEQLKSTYNDQGIPLVFCGNNETAFLMQVIQLDPTILNLTTKDGTPIIKLFSHFFQPDSEEYEMGKAFLSQLGINLDK